LLPCNLQRLPVRLRLSVYSVSIIHTHCPFNSNPYEESSWLLKPFQRSNSSTGKPGEHETFLLHVQAGVNALRREGTVLVFSGAKTEHAPLSEAASYQNILLQCFGESDLVQRAMSDGRILCEEAATDSYQNLLFSLIKYYEVQEEWPQMITVITHAFKENRFLVRVGQIQPRTRMLTRTGWPCDRTRIAQRGNTCARDQPSIPSTGITRSTTTRKGDCRFVFERPSRSS
jgi:hypothetical protein